MGKIQPSGLPVVNDLFSDKEYPQIKHTLLIKPNADESIDGKFTADTWAETVKNKLPARLNNIPVQKSVLTQSGAGYMLFPDVASRDLAKESLKENFIVESKNKMVETVYPKLRIGGIDCKKYNTDNCACLKDAIMQKNSSLRDLVTTSSKLFEILFIKDNGRGQGYAVAKVDPDIRTLIKNRENKLIVDLTSCNVSDRLHLVQCYACQQFGHKKGSSQCKSSQKSTCLYCSEEHQSKNCPNKTDVHKHRCSNCSHSSNLLIREKAQGHTCTSHVCPFVQNEAQALINRTMGMNKNAKNMDLKRVIVM